MSEATAPQERSGSKAGATTPSGGTPVPVDMSLDRRVATAIALLLAGPVIWISHFLLVYLVAEAGCTGAGTGLALLDPPVPRVVTLAATVVAALGCIAVSGWTLRRWRAERPEPSSVAAADHPDEDPHDPGGTLAFVGFILGLLSFLSVLMVGLPALALTC